LCATNLINFKRMLAEFIFEKIENKEAVYSLLVKNIFSQKKKEYTYNKLLNN
jgi:hypothetical protein